VRTTPSPASEKDKQTSHLFHESSLSITVAVSGGVDPVQQACLLSTGGASAAGGSCVVQATASGGVAAASHARAIASHARASSARGAGGASGASHTLITSSTASAGSAISVSNGGGTLGTSTADRRLSSVLSTQGVANRAGLTSELVGALLTAAKRATLLLELSHGDSWESGCGVVLSLVVVNFVDGDDGVDDGWLDGLLLDDWLDVLMDVVVYVLAGDGCCG